MSVCCVCVCVSVCNMWFYSGALSSGVKVSFSWVNFLVSLSICNVPEGYGTVEVSFLSVLRLLRSVSLVLLWEQGIIFSTSHDQESAHLLLDGLWCLLCSFSGSTNPSQCLEFLCDWPLLPFLSNGEHLSGPALDQNLIYALVRSPLDLVCLWLWLQIHRWLYLWLAIWKCVSAFWNLTYLHWEFRVGLGVLSLAALVSLRAPCSSVVETIGADSWREWGS